MNDTETKIAQVWKHLQSGRPITGKQAWQLYGYYRLSSCIHKLRKRNPDVDIRMEMMEENGESFGVYHIAKTDYIRLADGKKKGRAYNATATHSFFAEPFTAHLRPDCIIFLRASMFTKNGTHQAFYNGRSYKFHLTSPNELPLGEYKNTPSDNEDARIYLLPKP